MVVKSGYIDLKLPSGARSSLTWQGWKRKWLDLTQIESSPGQPVNVLVEVRNHRNSGVIACGTLTPKDTQVFRCGSGSKTHAVAIRVGYGGALLYLSGDTESESQEWMAAIRALLWPPIPMVELEKALGFKFEVSLVDDTFSGRAGLLGSYGNLSISGHKLILTHPHTEHVIQEWYLSTLVRFRVPRSKNSADHGKLLAIECGSGSSTGKGVLQFYCPEAFHFLHTLRTVLHAMLKRMNPEHYSWNELQQIDWSQTQENKGDQDKSKEDSISVLDMPTFQGPLPACAESASRPIPCSRQSHLSISTYDSGISVSTGDYVGELDSPASEVAFSVSSDTSEQIYEKLQDVVLRRTENGSRCDQAPPPLPPKNRKRNSEPVELPREWVEVPTTTLPRRLSLPSNFAPGAVEVSNDPVKESPYGRILPKKLREQNVETDPVQPIADHEENVMPVTPKGRTCSLTILAYWESEHSSFKYRVQSVPCLKIS